MSLFSCAYPYTVKLSNNFFSVDFSSVGASPITLDEVKSHLNVTFADDDSYLTALTDACISAIEKMCLISIKSKTVTILADINQPFELPYGPVTAFTSSSLKTATNIYTTQTLNSDYEIDNDLAYPMFLPYQYGRIKMIYTTGYDVDIPDDLKLAVLNEIAFRYENRGDSTNRYAQQNVGISEGAQALAAPYRRLSWL